MWRRRRWVGLVPPGAEKEIRIALSFKRNIQNQNGQVKTNFHFNKERKVVVHFYCVFSIFICNSLLYHLLCWGTIVDRPTQLVCISDI